EITDMINSTRRTIDEMKVDISRAIGKSNLEQLNIHLNKYSAVIEEIKSNKGNNAQLELELRTEGMQLREFSKSITHIERKLVNDIILSSKKFLFISFWGILFIAIAVGHFVSKKILNSLREIEKVALSISNGNFSKIEDIKSNDEFGSVIKAINYMSEQLQTREEVILQSRKLASLGILTAGVAHELVNPLNNISMISQNFVELYDQLNNESRIELMNKVAEETKRIEEIVKNLLDFSKPKEANLKEADINDNIRRSLKFMQNTLHISNIETKLVLSSDIPPVFIDENQIQQVLVNLILNAVQAMSPGGRLFIETRSGPGKDTVEIDVRDTGKGIPKEFLPYIFDPFFSTKGVRGTGLGMWVSYGIIKNHKGNIKVESTFGVGTIVTIELPVHKK
ncbi:MAG TPA: ATP-binding protein, partial [Thermodesulfovibrionales bacterium]|nr:ATP-binding protein [Thermodesulfovibrionales bacterium]